MARSPSPDPHSHDDGSARGGLIALFILALAVLAFSAGWFGDALLGLVAAR